MFSRRVKSSDSENLIVMRVVVTTKLFNLARSGVWLMSLLSVSALLLRADITSLSGTFTGGFSGGKVAGDNITTINLQGPNFSLTGSFQCIEFNGVSRTSIATVTFDPTAIFSLSPPYQNAGCPYGGSSNLTLVYNGQTYSNVTLSLSFAGMPAVTSNNFPNLGPDQFNYQASVSGVAFTMKGEVTAPPALSLNISGAGTAQAGTSGGFGGDLGFITYQFQPSPTGFSIDSTTQGGWPGTYGGDGYLIANGSSYQPSYAAVSVTQASTYTWASSTNDPRALQDGLKGKSAIASAYVGNSSLNIDFTDSFVHRVSIYLLDFDTNTRSETLTVVDADTGNVIDEQIISNFHNGDYANFDLSGNVVIRLTGNQGASAVFSGVFFGPSNSAALEPFPRSGTFYLSTDTSTESNWPSKYGSSGYLIPNDSYSTATSANVSVQGASTYTWAARTSDSRALKTSPTSTVGIASAFTQFPSTPFSIVVYNSVNVTLYLLDWDNAGRTEVITVSDLSTGVVSDTRTVSNFQNGIYLTWSLGGSSVITIQPSPGTNAAVSGVFIN